MIVDGYVRFEQLDPNNGKMTTELPLDLMEVLLRQAKSFEDLRLMWFGLCKRTSAYKHRKAKALKAAAVGV